MFDDFQEFNAESFVHRMLGLGDLKELQRRVERAMKSNQVNQGNEMGNPLIPNFNKFSIRELGNHFSTMQSMGTISDTISLIPGLNENPMLKKLLGKNKENSNVDQVTSQKFKQFKVIMDSMTNEELDACNFEELTNFKSRMERIARGSGTTVQKVKELLQQHKLIAAQFKQLNNFGNLTSGKGGNMSQTVRGGMPRGMDVQQMLKQFSGVTMKK